VDGRSTVYSGEGATVYTVDAGATAIFALLVAAHNHDSHEVAGWSIKGMIARAPSSGNARLIGEVKQERWGDEAAAGWSITVDADTTNHCLKVSAVGEDGKNIGWIGRLTTAELAF
jgi:hypothetical protein